MWQFLIFILLSHGLAEPDPKTDSKRSSTADPKNKTFPEDDNAKSVMLEAVSIANPQSSKVGDDLGRPKAKQFFYTQIVYGSDPLTPEFEKMTDSDEMAGSLKDMSREHPIATAFVVHNLLTNPSRNHEADIKSLVGHGFIPLLVEWLESDSVSTKIHSATALANIAANDNYTKTVVDADVMEQLIEFLTSTSKPYAIRSVIRVWGNLLGDTENCKFILRGNPEVIDYLIAVIEKYNDYTDDDDLNVLETTTWALFNVLNNAPQPYLIDNIHQVIQPLTKLLTVNDSEILRNVVWCVRQTTLVLSNNPKWAKVPTDSYKDTLFKNMLALVKRKDMRYAYPILFSLNYMCLIDGDEGYSRMINTWVKLEDVPYFAEFYNYETSDEQFTIQLSQFFFRIAGMYPETIFEFGILPKITADMVHHHIHVRGGAVGIVFCLTLSDDHERFRRLLNTPNLVNNFVNSIYDEEKTIPIMFGIMQLWTYADKSKKEEVLSIARKNPTFMDFIKDSMIDDETMAELAKKFGATTWGKEAENEFGNRWSVFKAHLLKLRYTAHV